MELKLHYISEILKQDYSFNRTFMELKWLNIA